MFRGLNKNAFRSHAFEIKPISIFYHSGVNACKFEMIRMRAHIQGEMDMNNIERGDKQGFLP